jgi:exonuclease SbcD
MSIRLMHLADLHLGAPLSHLGGRAAQRSQDLESALTRALALAPDKGVHAIAIAGDLFNSFNPPPEVVARVKAAFQRTAENGIPIVLITGTHDSHQYSRCVYRHTQFAMADILFDSGEHILKNINGHSVYFYGYSGGRNKSPDSISFRRNEEDGIHIALVHGSVSEGTHWSESSRDFSLLPSEIEESGFDYVALGHHHNFHGFKCGKSLAVYPGTLEGMRFGENGERYLVLADIDEDSVSLEKIKHNQRTLSEIKIDLALAGIESKEELAETIGKHADPDSIMKVVLSGTANFLPAREEIEALLSERFFHLEISDDTTVYESEMISSIAREDTVRGIFTRRMREIIDRTSGEEKETAELALRLGIEQFMRLTYENH